MKKLLIALLAIIAFSSSALAHPGSLDSNGGHWNHSTGEYHYHDGSSSSGSSSSSSSGGSSKATSTLITTGNVNMRSGPGTSYDVITTLPEGTKLPYGGQISGNWYKVWYGSRTGWVHRDYAKVVEWKNRNTYSTSKAVSIYPTSKPVHSESLKSSANVKEQSKILAFLNDWGEFILACAFILSFTVFAICWLSKDIIQCIKDFFGTAYATVTDPGFLLLAAIIAVIVIVAFVAN